MASAASCFGCTNPFDFLTDVTWLLMQKVLSVIFSLRELFCVLVSVCLFEWKVRKRVGRQSPTRGPDPTCQRPTVTSGIPVPSVVGSCRGFSTLPTAPFHRTGLLVKKPEDPTSKEEAVLRRPFAPLLPFTSLSWSCSPFLRRRRGLRRRRASTTTRYIRSPLLFPSCQYCFRLCQNRAPQTLI
jgi:hypothetical protein